MPAEISADALRNLLADASIVALLQRVHDGHTVDWDGSNQRGQLSAAAQQASAALERNLDALTDDESALAPVWAASDWLFGSCSLLDHWDGDQDLDDAAASIESDAAADGILIDGDVRRELLREAMRWLERLTPGLGEQHLQALIAAGMVDVAATAEYQS